jgi:hypothetical protein
MVLSAWCVALVLAQPAATAPFVLELTVTAGKAQQTVRLAEEDKGLTFTRPQEQRPVLKAAAGTPIQVRWRLMRSAGQPLAPDVLVHFYAARQERAGQPPTPRDDKAIQAESALKMDFRPGDRTQGEMRFTLRQAGTYVLRLETLGAAAVDGREQAVSLDLVLH